MLSHLARLFITDGDLNDVGLLFAGEFVVALVLIFIGTGAA